MGAVDQPSLEDCRDWVSRLISEWSEGTLNEGGLDSQQDSEESLYFQNFQIESPQGKMQVKTGSAPADCDAAIDSLVPNDILVKVRPSRAKKKYRDQADKLARLGKALLFTWRDRRDVIRSIVSDCVVRRVGVARVLIDDSRWPAMPDDVEDVEEWEAKYRRRCPVVLEPRNPRYVKWIDDDQGVMQVVVEHYPARVIEAKRAFAQYPNAAKILKDREPDEKVWVDDVWVGSYRCILIENDPVFPGRGKYAGVLPHGYPEIPYVICPFRELPFEIPGRRFRGMLTNAAGLYGIESDVLTMQVWMLAWNAWRTWAVDLITERPIEIMPGQTVPIRKHLGEDIWMLEGRAAPPELMQTVGVIDEYIKRNGIAGASGTADGTRSGQQVWALQTLRQLKIESARQGLQAMLRRALELAAMIIETNLLVKDGDRLVLPVPGRDKDGNDLGEVSISKGDIAGYWNGFVVLLDRRLDPAKIEQAKAMSALAQIRWIPRKTSWELSGLTDSTQEWEDLLLSESVNSLDFMIELAGLEQVKNDYGEDSQEYQLILSKLMAAKQAGQGQTPAPGVPSPGGLQAPSMKGPIGGTSGTNLGSIQRTNSAGGGTNNAPRPQRPNLGGRNTTI